MSTTTGRNAVAVFQGQQNGIIGSLKFYQPSITEHCIVHVELKNCKPNHMFACHVHEAGDLLEGCASTCSHFNPFGNLHGRKEYYGNKRHVGDLAIPNGNLVSDKNGIVSVTFCDDLISLYHSSPACILARAIVLHDKSDDGGLHREKIGQLAQESGKTGNAGSRIACAVIGIAKNNNFSCS